MAVLVDPAIAPGSLARLGQPVLNLDDCVLRRWQARQTPMLWLRLTASPISSFGTSDR
jgi:hypothetical protein